MQIKSLRLVNYRCFADSEEIPISKFCLFIGRNDGGKSSALLALHKLLGGEPFDNEDHRKEPVIELDDDPSISDEMIVYVRLSDSEEDYHYRCVRRILHSSSTVEATFEIESDCVDEEDLNQDLDSLTVELLKKLCDTYEIFPVQGKTKSSFVSALQAYRDTLPKQKGWISAPKSFKDKLPKVYLYSESTESDPEQTIKKTLNDFYRNDILPDHQDKLDGLRDDVEKRLNEKATGFVSVLQEHCGTVENVSVELSDSSFQAMQLGRVRVTQMGGVPVDWMRIGRGKRREMSLAVFQFLADLLSESLSRDDSESLRDVVALFDEPDLNLDYDAQRRVSKRLQTLSLYSKCQVLVSTHSAHLINSTTLNQICFFDTDTEVTSTSKVVTFDPGDDAMIMDVLRESMGLGNSILFNEKLFVVCEGATELGALPILFGHVTKQSLSIAGICVINGWDCDGAKRTAGVLRKNKRKTHLLLDNDCTVQNKFSANELSKCYLKVPDDVTFIGDQEFEDVFSNDLWMDVLNAHCPMTDGTVWSIDDIETARSEPKFSKAIMEKIESQATKTIGKPELGGYIALMAAQSNRIPDSLMELMLILQQRAQEV